MSQGGATTVVETSGNSATGNATAEPVVSPDAPGWRRGFWSLVVTQFQGAFNENGLKNLVVFLILGMAMQKGDRDQLVLIVGTLFSLPFILFSMTGGFLADRYSKRSVTIWTKFFEMGVMGLAIAGLGSQNLHLEMGAVFLASTQGALFGPSKYGLLPELLPESLLSWAMACSSSGHFWR
jgi:MFS family permease